MNCAYISSTNHVFAPMAGVWSAVVIAAMVLVGRSIDSCCFSEVTTYTIRRMNRTLIRMTPLLAAGLLALAACSAGGDSSTNTVPADADVVVRAVDGIAWNQDEYTATAGDGKVKIYAVNDSGIAHDMYVLDGENPIGDFIDLPKRGSDGALVYELAPGEYRIVCKIPGHANMNSKLTVN